MKKRDERTFSSPNFNYRDECNDDENLWSSSEILISRDSNGDRRR